MSTIQSITGFSYPPKIFKDQIADTGPNIGLEIELEQVQIIGTINNWEVKQDNSLKIGGMEFTVPLSLEQVPVALKHLFDNIAKPLVSKRCSIHVHYDVLPFTTQQLWTFIYLYIIYEKILFNFAGKRWDSNYCVPLQTYLIKNIEHWPVTGLEQIFPKYAAIHIFADGKLGTVEFRHMPGSTNIEYIHTWTKIIAALGEAAKNIPYEQLKERINGMRTTSEYWELSKEVFSNLFPILNYSNFQKDVEYGITYSKLLLKAA
jgi:hypothetical protein